MKKNLLNYSAKMLLAASVLTFGLLSCEKNKKKDVVLPPISGYNNSDEVAKTNLVGYWSFEGNGNESKTNTAPTSSDKATYVDGGVMGKALNLDGGYLYYAKALAPLTSNQGFSVSAWVQAKNNFKGGGAPPLNNFPMSYFQSAIPGQLFGNITAMIESGQYAIASDTMILKSIYKDKGGGTQDNINNYGDPGDFGYVKKAGTSQWVNVITTYSPTGGAGTESIFRIYADSVMVSNKKFENRRAASFQYSPNEIIIGGWYNNIPGKTVSSDTWTMPFTGKIDEIRVWNKTLTEAEIIAIYKLGKAGR
ncbi:MAG: LamG-like jellyroll fold domain-containing protein [Ginsengibacter sp.]